MLIIARYVVIEVLKVFLLALLVLTLISTLGIGVRDGLRNGLPPMLILKTMPYMMPEMLGITLPVAMLLGVTTVFARMAGANEIVALKSLGISPAAVVWPIAIVAWLLSLGTVWMYEVTATWSRPSVRSVVTNSVVDIAYGVLRTERSFASEKFSIAVKRVIGRRLIRPMITIHADGGRPEVTFAAQEAELKSAPEEGGLRLLCYNGEVKVDGKAKLSFPDTMEHVIPIDPPERLVHRDWLAMREIPAEVKRLKHELLELEEEAEAEPGSPSAAASERCKTIIYRLQTEPYRRWANGFSCLCFALVGAPVAMVWRFDSFLASFFACFLPILSIYYPLLMVQEDLTTSGALPPQAFWMGNVVLLLSAAFLMRRVVRY